LDQPTDIFVNGGYCLRQFVELGDARICLRPLI
jgi:hypothetical protein